MPRGAYPESKGKCSLWRNPEDDIVCAPGKPGEWSMGDSMETWHLLAAGVEQNHGLKCRT